MGRMKVAGAVAAVVIVVTMGVAAVITRASSGSTAPNTVASQAAVATLSPSGDPNATIAGASASIAPAAGGSPGTRNPETVPAITLPTHPSAEDVQRILSAITAEIMAPPSSTATTTPLTKAQVEQEVRSKLSQLGINF